MALCVQADLEIGCACDLTARLGLYDGCKRACKGIFALCTDRVVATTARHSFFATPCFRLECGCEALKQLFKSTAAGLSEGMAQAKS